MDEVADMPRSGFPPSSPSGAVEDGALRQTLGAWHLILLVVAAAAPMAAVVGIVPVAFAFGNGAELPLTVLGVSLVLALFSVGYSAMSRRIVSTGAFYSYVTHGLGGVAGLGAAFVAMVSYVVVVTGALAYFGYFSQVAVAGITGWSCSWIWFAAIGGLLVAGLGYRGIDLSFRVIAVLLVAEFVIILCLVASIIGRLGTHAFPMKSFSFQAVGSGTPGIAVMLVFLLFIGFESAALYSEEARDPRRSVARATYGAVAVMGAFYVLTTWVTVGAVGAGRIMRTAQGATGDLYFTLTADFLAPWVSQLMEVLVATSMFATALALHNVASRYLFSLGRQRCLPGMVGRVHTRYGGPHVASVVVSIITTSIVVAGFLSGMSPMVGLGTVAAGLGTVGVMTLQCLASMAVIGYFRRHGEGSWWSTLIAPLLALAGMGFGVMLAITRFDLLSGASNAYVNALPALIGVAFLSGAGYSLWLKVRRPDRYRKVTEQLGA
ncbi:APC family permease [Streptomyces mirabilis]|uniref:APC family permease n=1 Tax=Streptomyces mirabilis TaxID=68239 RepID=UPI0036551C12